MRLDHFLAAQVDRIRSWQPPQTFRAAGRPSRLIEHGTIACYLKLGCRCLPCKAAMAQYKAERRYAQRQRLLAHRDRRRVA